MRLLVIGRSGQVARALMRRAEASGVAATSLGRPDLDLTQTDEVADLIVARRPEIVINAAAYTAVDKAEREPELAFKINAAGSGAVARGAAEAGARLLHVSTDYVFSGEKAAPYIEDDPTGPVTQYGASKLAGEKLTTEAMPDAVIIRTAWVFDASGANFVRTMLRLAKTRDSIAVVSDQRGCPTYADDLADALLSVATAMTDGVRRAGIYHCAGAGEATWAGFAEEIFALSRARGGPVSDVAPIRTADYPTLAKRPPNSRLDCAKLAADFGVEMRPWRQALSACVDEIAAGGWRVE